MVLLQALRQLPCKMVLGIFVNQPVLSLKCSVALRFLHVHMGVS